MLPIPDAQQLVRSATLRSIIEQKIQAAPHHIISFADYMELALYTPELGYYMAPHAVFGREGDFITAPELSPLFAQCLAQPVSQVLEVTHGDILEFGAGSGKLAAGLLTSLPELPNHYYIYEISPALRERQKNLLQQQVPHFYDRIIWLEQLPEKFSGIILANEVIDALPADCFMLTEHDILARGVTIKNQQLQWAHYPANEKLLNQIENIGKALPEVLPRPYISEVQLGVDAWIKDNAQMLQHGVILLIDYGFPRREYYHPERSMGTLMCHYRQFAHGDPFWYPGLQDITVHVDFTAVAEAGVANHMDVLGYTAQAPFLIGCGLIDILKNNSELNYAAKHQVQLLTSPAEMGELFKVMALGKKCELPLIGFEEYSRGWN